MISDEYAAGFFDGEGSVYAATRGDGKSRNKTPTIMICISNTNLNILELHKEKWGGSIQERRHLNNDGWQRQWQWVMPSRLAEKYLRAILPHVVIKKNVVQYAIEYRDLMNLPVSERLDYSKKERVRPEFKEKINSIYKKIRIANSKSAPNNKTRKLGVNESPYGRN